VSWLQWNYSYILVTHHQLFWIAGPVGSNGANNFKATRSLGAGEKSPCLGT